MGTKKKRNTFDKNSMSIDIQWVTEGKTGVTWGQSVSMTTLPLRSYLSTNLENHLGFKTFQYFSNDRITFRYSQNIGK